MIGCSVHSRYAGGLIDRILRSTTPKTVVLATQCSRNVMFAPLCAQKEGRGYRYKYNGSTATLSNHQIITMACSDSHVTIVPYFTVPEGKMDAFKAGFADFYKHTKEGTAASGECLYYGFAQEGNKIFCREGYKSAAGVLAHLDEVKAELDMAVSIVGPGGLDLAVMGPAAELVCFPEKFVCNKRVLHTKQAH